MPQHSGGIALKWSKHKSNDKSLVKSRQSQEYLNPVQFVSGGVPTNWHQTICVYSHAISGARSRVTAHSSVETTACANSPSWMLCQYFTAQSRKKRPHTLATNTWGPYLPSTTSSSGCPLTFAKTASAICLLVRQSRIAFHSPSSGWKWSSKRSQSGLQTNNWNVQRWDVWTDTYLADGGLQTSKRKCL